MGNLCSKPICVKEYRFKVVDLNARNNEDFIFWKSDIWEENILDTYLAGKHWIKQYCTDPRDTTGLDIAIEERVLNIYG